VLLGVQLAMALAMSGSGVIQGYMFGVVRARAMKLEGVYHGVGTTLAFTIGIIKVVDDRACRTYLRSPNKDGSMALDQERKQTA
jgi:hypothetical protein